MSRNGERLDMVVPYGKVVVALIHDGSLVQLLHKKLVKKYGEDYYIFGLLFKVIMQKKVRKQKCIDKVFHFVSCNVHSCWKASALKYI